MERLPSRFQPEDRVSFGAGEAVIPAKVSAVKFISSHNESGNLVKYDLILYVNDDIARVHSVDSELVNDLK